MTDAAVLAFALILVRIATFVALLPLFGGRNLPHTVKIGLSTALAGFWFSMHGEAAAAALADPAGDIPWLRLAILCGREALLGGALAFALGLFLVPMRIAGAYIGQEMGLSMATMTDPSGENSSTLIAQIIENLGVLLFFVLDLHHVLLTTLHASFLSRPAGTDFTLPRTSWLLHGINDAHEAGLLLAAPVGVVLFVTTIVLLVSMRAVPQFNLFSVGMTVRLAAGLLAMLIFLPEMCGLMSRIFTRMSFLQYG